MFLEGKIKHYNSTRGFGFIQVEDEPKDIFFHIKDFPSWHIKPNEGELLKFRVTEEQGKFKASDIVRLNLKPEDQPLLEQHSFNYRSIPPAEKIVLPRKSVSRLKYMVLFVLIVIAGLGFVAYQKVQDHRVAKQLKAEQLIKEQKRIVEQQREALGHLPDRILSVQGRKNLDTVGYAVNMQQRNISVSPQSEASKLAIVQKNEPIADFKCDGRTHCSQMRSYDEAVFFIRNCPNTQMDGNHDGEPCEKQFRR
ncbi:cold shock domain-containing protein [Acinetobacter sp. PK01]|uniref:cold shock domain-containing protein n=1 Tax=Acinetobacter sp. PK01 TaxID=2930198 RepID=UPI001FB71B92|nr:cold shock domain-containing protein [Acinetobacter sp. PK01]UOG16916.1 cold shock domain-containing protein [Acinetobacter sp. PK01]